VCVEGKLDDQPLIGNKLHFSLEFDQTHLRRICTQLQETLLRFPVIGSR
jgi:hypothetical protein